MEESRLFLIKNTIVMVHDRAIFFESQKTMTVILFYKDLFVWMEHNVSRNEVIMIILVHIDDNIEDTSSGTGDEFLETLNVDTTKNIFFINTYCALL